MNKEERPTFESLANDMCDTLPKESPREWKVKYLLRELRDTRAEYSIMCANDDNNKQYLARYKELDITIKTIAEFIEFNQ